MAHCSKCGQKIGYLPFRCHHCSKTYCFEHRLPETHNCRYYWAKTHPKVDEAVYYDNNAHVLFSERHKDGSRIKRINNLDKILVLLIVLVLSFLGYLLY
ncbi:MAG: zinc finger AN1 domain-containing stress-associated protein, partial [Candidatus Altiarchaeota archaeon]